jgi:hypothetical protein
VVSAFDRRIRAFFCQHAIYSSCPWFSVETRSGFDSKGRPGWTTIISIGPWEVSSFRREPTRRIGRAAAERLIEVDA